MVLTSIGVCAASKNEKETKSATDYIYMTVHHPDELNQPAIPLTDSEKIWRKKPTKMTNFMKLVSVVKVPEVIELAIKSGANVNAQDDEGKTPLNYMAGYNYDAVEALDVLIKNSKNVDNQGKKVVKRKECEYCSEEDTTIDGDTPLLEAINANQPKRFIEHLVNGGANVNIVVDNESPLSLAASKGRTDILELLLEKGAKIGPKASEKIAWNDNHDESILKDYAKFDFENITHDDKHKYMSAASANREVTNAPYIKHQKDFVKEDLFKLHGEKINDWLYAHQEQNTSLGPLDSSDGNLAFDNFAKSALVGGKTHSEKKMIARYYFAHYSLSLPPMKKVFMGNWETKTKEVSVPDAKCQGELDYIAETRWRMANCTHLMMKEYSPYSYTKEMFQTCADAEYQANRVYSNAKAEIMTHCRHVNKEVSYEEFYDGVLAYILYDTPVILLPVNAGKLSYRRKLESIPYSRVLEEIDTQYGGSHKTTYTDNLTDCKDTHTHIIYGSGDWDLIIRVQFKEGEKITASSEPIAIEQFFMNTRAIEAQMEQVLKLLDSAKNDHTMQEQTEYFMKEKGNKQDRIQSFHL